AVLHAALKYDIDFVAAKARHSWDLLSEEDPVRAYATACLNKWQKEALGAARSALKLPIWPLEPPQCIEYDLISANTVLRLEQYHRSCAAAAQALTLGTERISWGHALTTEQCEHCGGTSLTAARHQLALTSWMNKYLSAIADEFASRPAPSTAFDKNVVESTIREAYEGQRPCELHFHTMEAINRFVKHFARKVEVVLCDVDLILEF
ncbi:hypothetical protein EIP91_003092, partial [Steccherinum ochraceum]